MNEEAARSQRPASPAPDHCARSFRIAPAACEHDASTLRVGDALALGVYALMNLPGAIDWIALAADARVFAGINVVLRG